MSNKTKPQLELELREAQARIAQLERALKMAVDNPPPADDAPLRQLLEMLPVGVSILNGEHQVVFQNSALSHILHLTPEGLKTGTYKNRRYLAADGSLMPVDGFASAQAKKSGQAVYDVETGIILENGDTIWTNVSAVPVNLPDWKTVVVTTDITERKQAEEKLQTLTNLLSDGQRIAHLGSFEYDAATQRTIWSEEECRIYGYDPAQPSPDYETMLAHSIHPADADLLDRTFLAAIQHGTVYELEHRIVQPDGRVRWVYDHAQPYFDERGQLLRYVGVTQDITERKQAEDKLRESEEFLRLAYEATDLGIWKNDLQTGSVEFDERARIHYGFDTVQTTLAEVTSRVHPEDVAKLGSEIAAATAPTGSGKFTTEYRVTHPDGSVHWLAIGVRVTFEGEGEQRHSVVGYGTTLDITDRKTTEQQLRASERNYRELVQNANSAIIRWKTDGTIAFFNEFAQSFFGYAVADVLGKPVSLLVPETDSTGGDLSTLVRDIATHPEQFINVINENVRRDGSRVWMVWTNKPIYDDLGQVAEILAVGVDITDRKRIEDDLRRSNAELEQFAYIASHDLQEPLRTVAGMMQLLQQRYQGQLDARADEYIHYAVDASNRMQDLINDLLDFSRVERKGRPFAATDLEKVLQMALANLQGAIAESGAQITHDPLPTVQVDAGQITQVLQNLLSNAIKFRSEQPPEIHLSAVRLERGWQFAVQDNGIGIEPQYFDRVFLIFQRLHTRRKYPGTGIGLALCKKIIERHGGKMWIQSELNHGATFFFTLPERI